MPFFVYVVRCKNGTLYTGTAQNVKKRITQHNSKKGAKYTRAFGPVKLLWSKKYPNRSKACQMESKIKSWPRSQKLQFIRSTS